MRIGYYISSLPVGGAETLVTNELLALKSRGHEVFLIVVWRSRTFLEERLRESGIPVHVLSEVEARGAVKRLLSKADRILFMQKRWLEVMRSGNPDVLHLHSVPAVRNYGIAPCRVAYSFHTNVSRSLSMQRRSAERRLAALADGGMTFFAIGSKVESEIRSRFPGGKVVPMPNAVDLSAMRAQAGDRAEILASLGIPPDAFVLGHVARIDPVKNHAKTIEVFRLVHERRPNSHLLLVGRADGEYAASIRMLVQSLGLEGYVHFLGVRRDAARVMGACDATMLPSLVEGFSLVLIEAQALGVRTVGTSAAPPEVFCNRNCFPLDPEAPSGLWADVLLGEDTEHGAGNLEMFDMPAAAVRLVDAYGVIAQSSTTGNRTSSKELWV